MGIDLVEFLIISLGNLIDKIIGWVGVELGVQESHYWFVVADWIEYKFLLYFIWAGVSYNFSSRRDLSIR